VSDNTGSSLTQALGVVAVSSAIALSATNIYTQQPVDAYAQYFTYSTSQQADDVFSSATSELAIPIAQIQDKVTLTKSDSRWHKYVVRRLEALRHGQGDFTGLRIPEEMVVDRAWNFATQAFRSDTPTPSVVPTEDGDILFVWRKAGWELEVTIGAAEDTVWARNRDSGVTTRGSLGELQATVSSLLAFLAWH
jgi:hypothetical protein